MTAILSLDEILERLRQGDGNALSDLAAFAEDHPDSAESWAHLAWNQFCRDRLEEAERAAIHSIPLLPHSPDVHHLLSRIYFHQGQPDQCLEEIRLAMDIAEDPFAYRLELIENLLHFRRPFAALREYRQLRNESSATKPIPARLLSRIAVEAALNALAHSLFVPALRDWVFNFLYRHYEKRGQYGKAYLAAKCPASSLDQDGRRAEMAADCLYKKREFLYPDYETEIAWRREALRAGRSEAEEKLARALLHSGKAQSTADLLQSESNLSVLGKETLAHSYAQLRQYQPAQDLYLQLGHENPIHYINAGITALSAGETSRALLPLAKAKEQLPGHPLAEFLYEAAKLMDERYSLIASELDSLLQKLAKKHRWINRISEGKQNWEQAILRMLDTHKYRLIPCPHCGSSSYTPMYLDPVPRWVRGRCDACGFLFANPMILPQHIAELYTNESSQSSKLQRFFRQSLEDLLALTKEETGEQFAEKERWWEPQFSLVNFERQRGSSRRMLDVGCSVGTLMYQFHCRGWHTSGIDLDPHGVAVAQSIGMDARVVAFEEADFAPNTFDYITLMDVIEHVPDYKPLLDKLYAILKPGGVLKVKTPCPESVIHYTYGPQWVSSDTHLMYFSRRILLSALRQQGFEIVATRSYLEANKIMHTFTHWREQNITPLFDPLVIDWDIGDTILVLARKP